MTKFHIENNKKIVTVIKGDGIGAEVIESAIRVVEATGVAIGWEYHKAGAEVFKAGDQSGVPKDTVDSINRTRVVLKGPLETPVGFGEKSANVTLRKMFETFANIRPVYELPGVKTPFSGRNIDLVVVRENIEDVYAGIEHTQSPGVTQCLKLITRKGTEKIIRFAFELARAEGRKKVHCATKANIMKFTEGLFKKTFEDVAKEYPDIEAHHIIIDNCAHQLVRKPEQFDVIVTTNMNGDIISDLTSGLVGGLGFAPSSNIGENIAIFEAVHGSAPDIAGKGLANPTALLLTAGQLLRYLNEFEAAAKIENAVLYTLEQGKNLTSDFASDGNAPGSTKEFTDTIIANLGKSPTAKRTRPFKEIKVPNLSKKLDFVKAEKRADVGFDLFVESHEEPEVFGSTLAKITENSPFQLKFCSNRGTIVYPVVPGQHTDCIDVYRCRFMPKNAHTALNDEELLHTVQLIGKTYRWMHIEKLLEVDGKATFSRSQGEK